MKFNLFCLSVLITGSLYSQSYNFTVGERRSETSVISPETETFENYGKKYILYKAYSMKEGMQVQLQGFKENNDYLCSKKLYVPEEKMLISLYEGVLNLDNNMQLIKSTFNKEAKKTFIYAHAINEFGDESDDKKELLSIAAEKAMNQGNFDCATSLNRKYSVILSELPFVKETKEKIMITVFDKTLKTIYSKEFELPYDAKRGPVNTPVIANDGSVYIIKKADISKMPDLLTVFCVSPNGESFKEAPLKLDDPKKYESHGYTLNAKNELILAGFYTEDGKVSLGGTKQKGTFYMNVNSKGDVNVLQTTAFEKAFTYIKIKQVLIKEDGQGALISEYYMKNNNTTMEGNQPVYTTEINQGNTYVHLFNQKGEMIKALDFFKNHKSIDEGGLFGSVFAAYHKDKLVVVYNDSQYRHDGKKYIVVPPTIAWITIPVFQTIDLASFEVKETAQMDGPVGGKTDITHLLPATGYKLSANELFFIGSKKGDCMPVVLKME